METGKDTHASGSYQAAAPAGAAKARARAAEGGHRPLAEARADANAHQATEDEATEDERWDAHGSRDARARRGAGRPPPRGGVRLRLPIAGACGVLPATPSCFRARGHVAR